MHWIVFDPIFGSSSESNRPCNCPCNCNAFRAWHLPIYPCPLLPAAHNAQAQLERCGRMCPVGLLPDAKRRVLRGQDALVRLGKRGRVCRWSDHVPAGSCCCGFKEVWLQVPALHACLRVCEHRQCYAHVDHAVPVATLLCPCD